MAAGTSVWLGLHSTKGKLEMKRTVEHLLFCLLLAIVALPILLLSQTTDPLVGTWKLNVAASKYEPGPPPKSVTRSYEDWGGGLILATNKGVDAQGNPTWAHEVFKFDGRDYPYAASTLPGTSPSLTTVAWKRIDAHTFENTVKVNGKAARTNTYALSKDGKTLTQRQKGADAQSQPTNNVLVYDRQ
jgi:hypothetical protein